MTLEGRTQLGLLLSRGLKQCEMAAQMGRSGSSISCELRRNRGGQRGYLAAGAHQQAGTRRVQAKAGCRKLGHAFDSPLGRYVLRDLQRAWSPEQIRRPVRGAANMVRGNNNRTFAKARPHLCNSALDAWTDKVLVQAESAGMVLRWQRLRPVASDASVLMPGIHQHPCDNGLAATDQRLFALLYLPGAELTLRAAARSACEADHPMLANALDILGPDYVLLLDHVLLLDRSRFATRLINLHIDMASKVLDDDLRSLMCAAAHCDAQAQADQRCAPTTALHGLQCTRPTPLVGADFGNLMRETLAMIARSLCRHRPGRIHIRPNLRSRPNPIMTYRRMI